VIDNTDAEPVTPCAATKTAIIVYGKQLGRKLTVCTDKDCPVHDPQAAAEAAANPVPTIAPAPEAETEEEAAERGPVSIVCRACSTAWRCKSSSHPDGGEVIAKRKGVVARRGLKEAWSRDASRWTRTGYESYGAGRAGK